ncbi:MAG: antitoxin [Geodermatophilaceae bacterium]
MGTFDNLKGKVSDLVDQHSDTIQTGMDKAGDFVDSKSGGKHTEHIATGKDKLRDALDGLDGKNADDFPSTPPPSVTPQSDIPPPRPAH